MHSIVDALAGAYARCLAHPKTILALILLGLGVSTYYAAQFRFDASSETLVVEGDPDLAAYTRMIETFGGDAFLLVTFSPSSGKVLDADNLARLGELTEALRAIPDVAGTFSILDVPLLKSPPQPLSELADGLRTLTTPGTDIALAKAELTSSPLFRELLITADGETSAVRVDIAPNEALAALEVEIAEAKAARRAVPAALRESHRLAREAHLQAREALIAEVRQVRERFRAHGTMYIGGVPMIASDMIAYVKNDLAVFGGTVVVIMMVVLWIFFRRWRWVFLPIAASGITVWFTVGALGFLEKPATVISSNFISLLAITTISIIIHLIVRYRELLQTEPELTNEALVRKTMQSKFAPCLYTAATTMAAFGSLIASSIVPVEDFGRMMCLGIAFAFVVTFTFFPAALLLLPRGTPSVTIGQELALTRGLGQIARWRSGWVVTLSALLAVAVGFGLTRVSLDNRFVDYFRAHTDISQGMNFIDRQLGGTLPLDVVVRFAPYESYTGGEDEDDFAFDDFAGAEEDPYPERYWFTRDKLDKVTDLHRRIESIPGVGKTLSLTSLEDLAREFTEGRKLSNPEVAGILGALPEDLRGELIAPYADPDSGGFRLNARVRESDDALDKQALASTIEGYAVDTLALDATDVEVTGMVVLFNSMLRQLFQSQVDTLVWVLLATFAMFLLLLHSPVYAFLGLIPNVLAAATVVAFMGYAGIPLDMMTITIAAISIGIGVDDAIHYLHRYHEERDKWGDARVAVSWSHASIGRAMYFTTLTVMAGFSVLAFSNFVPTVMFGLLVAIAMALALLANLTLLPSLLVLVYGKRGAAPVPRVTTTKKLEAEVGIEPAYTELQSAA